MKDLPMPRSNVTRTEEERRELESHIQKGGKGYRIRHTQILLCTTKLSPISDAPVSHLPSSNDSYISG